MIKQLISEIKTTKKEIRSFGITIGLILLIIGAILLWKNNINYPIFMIIGIVLLVSGLVIPIILKPIFFIWMVFANAMGWIMTRVILGLLFYTMLTPIGVICRAFGKRFLASGLDESKESNWNYRHTKQPQKQDYEKQF